MPVPNVEHLLWHVRHLSAPSTAAIGPATDRADPDGARVRPARVAYLPEDRPCGLLVAWRGSTVVGAAARISGDTAQWVAYDTTSRGYLLVDDENAARAVLADMPLLPRPPARYERDDPETGDPLPAGVDGWPVGRRH